MTWSLNASGHTADAEHERELHAELHKVLSNPRYGATGSSFSGNHATGAVHVPAAHETEHVAEHAEHEAPTHVTETTHAEHGHVEHETHLHGEHHHHGE